MNIITNNNCTSCGKNIKGRSDKKFCNDYCRHLFHNKNRQESDVAVKKINNILLRNRKIISSLLKSEYLLVKIKREEMLERGFVFRYFTHRKINSGGTYYYFCYDYGYLLLENEYCLLLKEERDY